MFSFLPNSRYFGIHIDNHRVTAAYLGNFGVAKIKGIGIADLERSPWLKNGLRDPVALGKAIKSALTNAQPKPIDLKQVVLTLPETAVFTKALKLPTLSRKELVQTIPFEAADALPLPIEEVYLDWQIDTTQKAQSRVLVVAVPKKIVDELIAVVAEIGLEVVCLESEPFSIARSLNHLLEIKTAKVICSIGHDTTTIILATRNHIKFTSTVLIGRKRLRLDKKVSMNRLAEEINESLKYYRNRLGEPEVVKEIILTGEGALLPDLVKDLEAMTKLSCQVGYPELTLPDTSRIHPKFTTATGVALWKKT